MQSWLQHSWTYLSKDLHAHSSPDTAQRVILIGKCLKSFWQIEINNGEGPDLTILSLCKKLLCFVLISSYQTSNKYLLFWKSWQNDWYRNRSCIHFLFNFLSINDTECTLLNLGMSCFSPFFLPPPMTNFLSCFHHISFKMLIFVLIWTLKFFK